MNNNYLTFALKTAESTGREIMKHFAHGQNQTRGSAKDIKSFFDKVADRLIKKAIEKEFPTHSYLTEETGHIQKDPKFLWIIDPIDGTANFVNGNPLFGVSIALWLNGQPVISVMEAPAIHERYLAIKNKGAWFYNLRTNIKKRAKVSNVSDLSKSYLVYCDGGYGNKAKIINYVANLYPKTTDIRKLGSAVIELAWVGTGRAEAYFSPALSIWDLAAGVLFVKEAGGKILDFKGKEYSGKHLLKLEEINLLATNGKITLPQIKM